MVANARRLEYDRCMQIMNWRLMRVVARPDSEQCDPVVVRALQSDTSFAGPLRDAFTRRFRPEGFESPAEDIRLEILPSRRGLLGSVVGEQNVESPRSDVAAARVAAEKDLSARLLQLRPGVRGRYLVTLRERCIREFPGERGRQEEAPRERNAGRPYFEFQVEKTVLAQPGNPQPTYPSMLHSAGVEGHVLAQFVVNVDGSVDMSTFKVLESSHDLFTQSVRSTLPRMRFFPAEIGGTKVRQVVQYPFVFTRR